MARIKVKLQNGEIGFIDDNEFDSKSMQMVDAPQSAPQVAQPSPQQSFPANIGSKAMGFLSNIIQPLNKFGGSLGQAAGLQTQEAKSAESSKQQLLEMTGKLTNRAAELNKAGKKKEAKALLKLAQEQGRFLKEEAQEQVKMAEKGQEDVVRGGVGTGAFFVPGGKTPLTRILASTVAGSGFGYSGSEKGEELESTIGGGVIGGVAGGALELLGLGASKILKKPIKPPDITGSKLKKDPFFSSTRQGLQKTASEIGISNRTPAAQKVKIIEGAFKTAQGQVDDLLRGSEPVANDVVNKNLLKYYKKAGVNLETKANKDLINVVLEKLNAVAGDNVALNSLKSEARAEMTNAFTKGGGLTGKQEIWSMVYNGIKDSLDTISPQIRTLNNHQNSLYGLADEFVPQAIKAMEKVSIKPLLGLSDARLGAPLRQETVRELPGAVKGGLESLLKLPAKGAGAVAGSQQVTKNVLLQQLMGGQSSQQASQQEQVSQSTTPLPDSLQQVLQPQQAPTSKFGQITLDQVNQAQLLLSPKTANKIIAIYDRQQEALKGGDETDTQRSAKAATEMATDALKTFEEGGIKTGPAGKIEQQKAKLNWLGIYGDAKTVAFNIKISALKASVAKARAGTSFTPNEEKLLEQYLPVEGDSEQLIRAKLKELVRPEVVRAVQEMVSMFDSQQ